ncbi:glutathione S-transferase family protein [Mesorhizobium microcysteis]|uniref:Glutathione S-transferase family protein n=1 Tax=Neoaquamicrobium microcysteis TaxID=2682781 RepID=A0A5D4GZL2_9HYPH|nr:glutathione S-transferase family protein [Mesorhizobium microcysteis]TYR34076.1 glutathione S-transferase family protein [Mesorhizobium microcysteis]
MKLVLYYHPLASFCWKVLVALYENDAPFERVIVDFGNEESRAAFTALWPMAKMPVLVDEARGAVVPESSTVIDYLETFHPGPAKLLPAGPDEAWQARVWDRFYDHYVHHPMQQIVGDALRPAESRDPYGVAQARALLRRSYAYVESEMTGRIWAVGDGFSLADASAVPALFYANIVEPFGDRHVALRAYHDRLMARPSVARVLHEAEPYFDYFPLDPKPALPQASREL